MSHHKKSEHHIRSYKIAAQTAGLVACIFILLLFAGKGVPSVLANDADELIPFAPFLLLAVSGYIVSWYHEFAGTLIMTGAGIILLVFFVMRGDTASGFMYGLPFIAAGAIFLLHISKREHLRKHNSGRG
ncbi:MAG: hypothetical protein JWP81_666 [Ferruginibacter sp.]|nr:hypothetical protein [Ferruginibacter sp.]